VPPSRRLDPSPLRWLIGAELARHREAAGLSMSAVSNLVGITKPKLGQMETGRQFQSATDIVLLMSAYNVDRDTIDSLVALTERAEEAAWATGSAHAVPNWFRIYLGLERIATKVFCFEPLLVPGLLQTEGYARSVTGSSLFVRTTDVDRVVAVRMARARRLLDSANPIQLHAVTTEAALRLQVGDDETRRVQLDHLLTLAQQPNVTIQLLPFGVGYHDAHRGHFVLLDFNEVRSLAYSETIDSALYVQDPDQVHHYELVSEQLEKLALDPERSRALIAEHQSYN
jgi:transcriptional regulator with XRE-family HTH domain